MDFIPSSPLLRTPSPTIRCSLPYSPLTPQLPPLPLKTPPPSERRYTAARAALADDPSLSIPKLAAKLGITPRYERTLRRRLQGTTAQRGGGRELLTEEEKEVIYRYTEKQAYEGFSADVSMIAERVGLLVRFRRPDYELPSNSWVHAFTHTKEFKSRIRSVKSKPIDHKRKTATDVLELRRWTRVRDVRMPEVYIITTI